MATKPLFKKKSKKIRNLRKRASEDEDNEEEHVATADAIRATQKKRKLIQSTVYKKGIDAATTIQGSKQQQDSKKPKKPKEDTNKDDLESRLKGTFSGGTGKVSSSDGVLERRHRDAMEKYVEENMQEHEREDEKERKHKVVPENQDAQSKLYQELADTAQKMMREPSKPDAADEDDVGAGGAVLGGTGIAEVILPVEERVEAAKATEAAAVSAATRVPTSRPRHDDAQMIALGDQSLPTSFSTGLGKRKHKTKEVNQQPKKRGSGWRPQKPQVDAFAEASASSAGFHVLNSDVSTIASSYNHNFQQHAKERALSQQRQDDAKRPNEPEVPPSKAADDGRLGFAAARKASRGEADSTKPLKRNQRATDDRVWKKFVKQERDKGR